MERHDMPNRRSWLVSLNIVAALLIGFLVGRALVPIVEATEPYEYLKIFTEVLSQIEKHYVEEPNTQDLINGAIRGMLSTLDAHSGYMPPDVYKEVQVETKGKFGGVGIQIGIRERKLTVIAPIEGTPAHRAGILAQDHIIKVDGESTKDMSLLDAVHKMRGPKGTKVVLTIVREGESQAIDFDLVRDVITIDSVRGKMLEDEIGYIRISQFQEQTAKELRNMLDELKKDELKSLVIDLRNNPGGLLSAAVGVTEQFLPSGNLIVSIKNRQGKREEYRAHADKPLVGIPIIVLVNVGSASGSEIVAGALQDWGRAVVVGTTTFGKGSVQTILPLSDGSGLRLTTAKYFTPKDRSIHGVGIDPNIVVEARQGTPRPVPTATGEVASDSDDVNPGPHQDDATGNPQKDVQLDKAIELLKTWNIFKSITPS